MRKSSLMAFSSSGAAAANGTMPANGAVVAAVVDAVVAQPQVRAIVAKDNSPEELALTVLENPELDHKFLTAASAAAVTAGIAITADVGNIASGFSDSSSEFTEAASIVTAAISALLTIKDLRAYIQNLRDAQDSLLRLVGGIVNESSFVANDTTILVDDLSPDNLIKVLRANGNIHIELTVPDTKFDLNARSLTDKKSISTIMLSLAPVAAYALMEISKRMGVEVSEGGRITTAVVTGSSPGHVFQAVVQGLEAYKEQVVKAYALVFKNVYVKRGRLHELTPAMMAPFLAYLTDEDASKMLAAQNNALRAKVPATALDDVELDEEQGLVAITGALRLGAPI